MSNERSRSRVPQTPQCCTCDGEEGPCAVSKVIFFAVKEQDATFEPALVLQGQPFHQQRGTPGQRHTACGWKGEGKEERVRDTERERVSISSQPLSGGMFLPPQSELHNHFQHGRKTSLLSKPFMFAFHRKHAASDVKSTFLTFETAVEKIISPQFPI